jgi:hypothetical protein
MGKKSTKYNTLLTYSYIKSQAVTIEKMCLQKMTQWTLVAVGDGRLQVCVSTQHLRGALQRLLPHVQPEALAPRQIYFRHGGSDVCVEQWVYMSVYIFSTSSCVFTVCTYFHV